jgi:hypothetical protein
MELSRADAIKRRMRDLYSRISRANIIKREYQQILEDLFKELTILEFGKPGDSISFHGTHRKITQGTISRFEQPFGDDKIICVIKVQGDFVSYETSLSNPKDIVKS